MGVGKRIQIILFGVIVVCLILSTVLANYKKTGSVQLPANIEKVDVPTFKIESPYDASTFKMQYAEPKDAFDRFDVTISGQVFSYKLFPPSNRKHKEPRPLIILLHGDGRGAEAMLDMWRPLAKEKNLIIAAPETDKNAWDVNPQLTTFIQMMPQIINGQMPVDTQRIYLFGYERGAAVAIELSVQEPNPFAAVAVLSGVKMPKMPEPPMSRKVPVVFLTGTEDKKLTTQEVHDAAAYLQLHGQQVAVYEITRQNHWYYSVAPFINEIAWNYLNYYTLNGPKNALAQ